MNIQARGYKIKKKIKRLSCVVSIICALTNLYIEKITKVIRQLKNVLCLLSLLSVHFNVFSLPVSDLAQIIPTLTNSEKGDFNVNDGNIDKTLLESIDKQVLQLVNEGDLLAARRLISQAINSTDFSQNPRTLVNRLLIRASLDRNAGANIAALQDLQLAFRLSASTNQQDLVADVAFTIASIHQSRNEHSIALSYIQQALSKYQQQGAVDKISHSLLLGISSLLATSQLEQAKEYLEEVKPYIIQSNDLHQKAQYFQFSGELQLYNASIDESIENFNIALKLVPPQNQSQLATLHLLLSQAYTSKNNMDLAIDHLIKAFGIANNTGSSFYLNQALQLHRATLLGQLNEFEAAFKVTQSVLKDRELHQPVSEIKRMLDMHANFQLELQQQENADLKYENEWKSTQIENKQMLSKLYFLVIGLLVCISSLLLLLFLRGRKHRIHLENVAHTDMLTGLYSRARVLELLEHHQNLYSRNLLPYCVAIVDLDYFKKINDTHGHAMGDQVLKHFGETCKKTFRKSDIVGRIGGEEFLIILPQTHISEAVQVFDQFNQKISKISIDLDLALKTTASIGVVTPIPNEVPMEIVKRADVALYEAKEDGRNRVVIGNK